MIKEAVMSINNTISPDVRKHMEQLELSTRRLLKKRMVGQDRSKICGFGFDFDTMREYQMGDDVRFIDWRSSARAGSLLVRQYRQEQGKVVLIAVDVSASANLGQDSYNKWQVQADLASVVALAASHAQDAVGLILFSNTIECYIPPMRSRHTARMLMEKIFEVRVKKGRADFAMLSRYLGAQRHRDALLIIVSDFIDSDVEQAFSLIGRIYDTIALRCLMPYERSIEYNAIISMVDNEAGTVHCIDARGSNGKRINQFLQQRITEQDRFFVRSGIDFFDVTTGTAYVPAMVTFLNQRMILR